MTAAGSAPAEFLIGDLPTKAAYNWPDTAAFVSAQGGGTRTFAALGDRVSRLAGVLRAAGVARATRVGILAENCPEFFELFFACARIGAVMVPINIRLSPREVTDQIHDAGMSHVVVHPTQHPLAAASGLLALTHWTVGENYESALLTAEPDHDPGERDELSDVAQMYTSGTTGYAKGCTQTQRGWLLSALNFGLGLRLPRQASVLSPAPYYHAFGFGLALSHLLVGGTVIVTPQQAGEQFWATVDAFRPHTMHPYAALPTDGRPRQFVKVLTGRAGLLSPMVETYLDTVTPAAEYFGVYGLTEATNIVMLSTAEEERRHPGTLGQPLGSVRVMVAAADGRPAPADAVGELLLRGPQLCSGYWNNPGATEDLFRDGWLHTGDLVRRDADGWLHFEDRAKDMIKSGGENVYSAEVERVLRSHPLVVDVAVFGVPDSVWGEAVKATVVLLDPDPANLSSLDEHCRANIAGFKRPRWYEIVDHLPVSDIGKVLKTALRASHDPRHSIRLAERS